ncbi:ABC transporter permease [Opitutales bacterium ASA1]|uniref:ABC transporter permease n=1 Tax=Congregicoccus parvus TaxID=3081749 RepID=UPI002B2B2D2B|nr:ABC transporter permease [Opitutales bacterium ASA1]
MKLSVILQIAVAALRRRPMRTLLTMLGVIIGVGAVVAMIGIGNGARSQMEQQVASLGRNVVMVMAGSSQRGGVFGGLGGAGTLTVEDAEAILREVDGVAAVSPEARGSVQVAYGNANWNTQLLGESETYPQIRDWQVASGSFYGEAEIASAARVAVLGRTVATKLFEDADPVGRSIRIGGAPYVVVGVMAAKGSNMMGQDQDDVVLVPYTTAMRRVLGQTHLRSISVSAAHPEWIETVSLEITQLLRQRHRIAVGRSDDFHVRTQQEIAEFATSTSQLMTALLGAIASVSLVVGGIGIMNIMLVSVTERTREIGTRIAVGARGRDIMLQFLVEAVMLSGLGGLLGIALGYGASWAVSFQLHWPTAIPGSAVALAFGTSAAIGVFFGFYPARQASRLDPIEALRFE